jgi:hypothetical protein
MHFLLVVKSKPPILPPASPLLHQLQKLLPVSLTCTPALLSAHPVTVPPAVTVTVSPPPPPVTAIVVPDRTGLAEA